MSAKCVVSAVRERVVVIMMYLKCVRACSKRGPKRKHKQLPKNTYSIEADVCAIFESRCLHCIVLYFGYAYDTAKQKAWIE